MNESSRLRETLRRESKMAWAPYKITFILGSLGCLLDITGPKETFSRGKICLRAIVPIGQSKIAKEEYDETLCKH